MKPTHAVLIEFGFPEHYCSFLEGYITADSEIGEIIEFLQSRGLVFLEENLDQVSVIFLDEESFLQRTEGADLDEESTSTGQVSIDEDLFFDSCEQSVDNKVRRLEVRDNEQENLGTSSFRSASSSIGGNRIGGLKNQPLKRVLEVVESSKADAVEQQFEEDGISSPALTERLPNRNISASPARQLDLTEVWNLKDRDNEQENLGTSSFRSAPSSVGENQIGGLRNRQLKHVLKVVEPPITEAASPVLIDCLQKRKINVLKVPAGSLIGTTSTLYSRSKVTTPSPVVGPPIFTPLSRLSASGRAVLHQLSTNLSTKSPTAVAVNPVNQLNPRWATIELTPIVLENLLKKSLKGKAILDLAQTGPLSERRQLELAEIVAEWHLENKTKLYEADVQKYALAITSLFTHEKKEIYFLPRGGEKKNPGGKIYGKISNLKVKRRKEQQDDLRQRNKNKSNKDYGEAARAREDEQKLYEAFEWLQSNESPWSVILEKWRVTLPLRYKFLGTAKAQSELERANLWRLLRLEHGFQLIDIDFQHMNLGHLHDRWDHIIQVAAPYIKKRSIDDPSETLCNILEDNLASKDSQVCALLLSLNCVLHPPKVTRTYKPPVPNGQQDTIIFAENDEEARTKIIAVYAEYKSYGMPTTPKIVFFGKALELTGVFRVYHEDIYYTLPTAARAVDVYIKWVKVLGLKHSKISKLVWLFIEQYIYDADVKERYSSIIKLIDYLNRCVPCKHEN